MSDVGDAETWQRSPLTDDERALDAVERWLPAGDRSDRASSADGAPWTGHRC